MNRAFLVKSHTVLAGFFFPTILLLIITGGLMNLGVDGSYNKISYTLNVDQPISTDVDTLKELVIKELNNRNLFPPKGKSDLEIEDDFLVFEWEGSSYNVILKNEILAQKTVLIIEEASLFSYLENLHTSEGGPVFKIFTIFCSVGLIILLVTGVLMAWHIPKYKILTIKSMAFGSVFFIVAILLS